MKLVDTGCVSSQADPHLPAWAAAAVESSALVSESVSERVGNSGRWGSRRRRRRRRRAAARRGPGVAGGVLQAPGRQDLGPGRLGSGRPMWRTGGSSRPPVVRIQFNRYSRSCPCSVPAPVLAAGTQMSQAPFPGVLRATDSVRETGG